MPREKITFSAPPDLVGRIERAKDADESNSLAAKRFATAWLDLLDQGRAEVQGLLDDNAVQRVAQVWRAASVKDPRYAWAALEEAGDDTLAAAVKSLSIAGQLGLADVVQRINLLG